MAQNGWVGRTVVLVSAALCLSGCVAIAAIPAVAGGIAAKKASDYDATVRAKRDQQTNTRAAAVPAPASLPRDASAPDPIPSGERPPLPSTTGLPILGGPRSMRPGIAYTGALPLPAAAPQSPSRSTPTTMYSSSWTDIGRYVAARATAPTSSVLLMRGSSSDSPAWAPCAGKPQAIIVRLDTVMTGTAGQWQITPAAAAWLDVFQTLEVPVILIGFAPAEARERIEAAFRSADLAKLLASGELRLALGPAAMPAERATIAVKRCVFAIVGRDASDFPNASLPEASSPAVMDKWGAGWFRVIAD